jgi:type VI secretion system protein ImpF
MPDLALQERLQPSLLDRLTDEEPQKQQEARAQRVLTYEQLRASVLRDLAWLLGAGNLESAEELAPYPDVARSVLNYGLRDLAGSAAAGHKTVDVERIVREAIIAFEPRILKDSLKVTVRIDDQQMNNNVLSFDIQGELWAQPLPLELYVRTDVDLETGGVSVTENRHGSPAA